MRRLPVVRGLGVIGSVELELEVEEELDTGCVGSPAFDVDADTGGTVSKENDEASDVDDGGVEGLLSCSLELAPSNAFSLATA